MSRPWQLLLIFVLAAMMMPASTAARAESMQIGLSADEVPITSDFQGTNLIVFGTLEETDPTALLAGGYRVVVVVRGPSEDVVVRKKERILGVWVNSQSRRFGSIPSFYSLATNVEVANVAPAQVLKDLGLGVDNIPMNLVSRAQHTFVVPAPEFSQSLRRIRANKALYADNTQALEFLSPTFYRATLPLPSSAPVGQYEVTAYLFKNGQMIYERSAAMVVRKAGFERWIFTLAHERSFLYGVMAVILAIMTGWLASIIFRRD